MVRTDSITLPAPAKLNLFLHVTGRRPDGYHDLQTVFQILDWGDVVHLQVLPGTELERGKDIEGVSEAKDLTLRAAKMLRDAAHARGKKVQGARISVDKFIPQGGGLGGASSDAATVLVGLNVLWNTGFTIAELAQLGHGLGADVPVFVYGNSAWAEGTGEQLTPLSLGERWYVLVFPPVSLETAAMFSDPELRRDSTPIKPPSNSVPESERYAELCGLGNHFLPVALKRSGILKSMVQKLSEFGSVCMSGTGSTLFLEAENQVNANQLTTRLKNTYNVRAVQGLDRSELQSSIRAHGP